MTLKQYLEKLQTILEKEGGDIEISRIMNGRSFDPVPRAVHLRINRGGGSGKNGTWPCQPWEKDESKGVRVVLV